MRKVGQRKDRDSKALCDGEWALEFWSYLSREFGEFVDFDLKPGFCEAEAVLLPPLHGCLNVCRPDCFVNTILAVCCPEDKTTLCFSWRVCPLHIYTFHFFSGSARHSEIPTYGLITSTKTLFDTCNPLYPICTEPDDVFKLDLRLDFEACLFSFQPKAWVWKVSPGKDGDAEALCDGKSTPYLAKQMQTLAAAQ